MTHIPLQAKIALKRWAELFHCRTCGIDTPRFATLILDLTPSIELICTLREQAPDSISASPGLCAHTVPASAQGGLLHCIQETHGLALERMQLKLGYVQMQRRGEVTGALELHVARLQGIFHCISQLILLASLIPKVHPPCVHLQRLNNHVSMHLRWFLFC